VVAVAGEEAVAAVIPAAVVAVIAAPEAVVADEATRGVRTIRGVVPAGAVQTTRQEAPPAVVLTIRLQVLEAATRRIPWKLVKGVEATILPGMSAVTTTRSRM